MNKKIVAVAVGIILLCAGLIVYFVSQSGDGFAQSLLLVVEYEDGSTQTFNPEKVPLFSYSIVDSTNKVAKSLRAELYVKVDYDGPATGWDAEGTLHWVILDSSKKVLKDVSRTLEPQETGVPPKNTPFVITSATVSASDIEAMWSGWENGNTYYLRFSAVLRFKINFSDSTSQTKDSYAVFDWQFKYEGANQFKSLQVTWQPVTYY